MKTFRDEDDLDDARVSLPSRSSSSNLTTIPSYSISNTHFSRGLSVYISNLTKFIFRHELRTLRTQFFQSCYKAITRICTTQRVILQVLIKPKKSYVNYIWKHNVKWKTYEPVFTDSLGTSTKSVTFDVCMTANH